MSRNFAHDRQTLLPIIEPCSASCGPAAWSSLVNALLFDLIRYLQDIVAMQGKCMMEAIGIGSLEYNMDLDLNMSCRFVKLGQARLPPSILLSFQRSCLPCTI